MKFAVVPPPWIWAVLDMMRDRNPAPPPPPAPPDRPRADVMFWHAHQYVPEPGEWGLRFIDETVATSAGRYVPAGETDLYQKYKSVIVGG